MTVNDSLTVESWLSRQYRSSMFARFRDFENGTVVHWVFLRNRAFVEKRVIRKNDANAVKHKDITLYHIHTWYFFFSFSGRQRRETSVRRKRKKKSGEGKRRWWRQRRGRGVCVCETERNLVGNSTPEGPGTDDGGRRARVLSHVNERRSRHAARFHSSTGGRRQR